MGGIIDRITIEVTGATGGAGVATANATSDESIEGTIRTIYLEYVGSPPAGTTDVTIVEAYQSPATDILTITNAATDDWFFPMGAAVNQAGTAITNQGVSIVVDDYIKATITGANNDDGVTVTIVYER